MTPETCTQACGRAFHPLANMFRLMKGQEFAELVDSIKANGLREPIVILDEMILDGRNRARACEAAGIEPRFTPFHLATAAHQDADPVAFVIDMNLNRRHQHLTAEQRRDLIAKLVKASPEKSDRALAAELGVGSNTVRRARDKSTAPHGAVAKRIGKDGKARKLPAKRAAKPSPDCDICHGKGTFEEPLFHPCGTPVFRGDGKPWVFGGPCPRCNPAEARKKFIRLTKDGRPDLIERLPATPDDFAKDIAATKADAIATAMPGDIGPMLPYPSFAPSPVVMDGPGDVTGQPVTSADAVAANPLVIAWDRFATAWDKATNAELVEFLKHRGTEIDKLVEVMGTERADTRSEAKPVDLTAKKKRGRPPGSKNTPEKRKPGRPKGSGNKPKPGKRGRPPGSKNKSKKPRKSAKAPVAEARAAEPRADDPFEIPAALRRNKQELH